MFHLHTAGEHRAVIICSVVLSCFLIVKPSQSMATYDKPLSPEDVTRQFYAWYLGAHFPDPKRSNMATFRKYVTLNCWRRATARDIEAVLFIDAQDTDETWASNFTVSEAKVTGQRATLQVDLNGKEMKRKLNLTLRREGGVWKIDDVKGVD
jgi:hypothetical protein